MKTLQTNNQKERRNRDKKLNARGYSLMKKIRKKRKKKENFKRKGKIFTTFFYDHENAILDIHLIITLILSFV